MLICNALLANCDRSQSKAKPKKRSQTRNKLTLSSSNANNGNNITETSCSKDSYHELDEMIARITSPTSRFPETVDELQIRCQ